MNVRTVCSVGYTRDATLGWLEVEGWVVGIRYFVVEEGGGG